MSDQEFDNYIALLGRTLRLSPAQRAAIADELRDHMEQRLAELTARGVDRDHALTIALEEFGDANALADEFTRIDHHKHRRQVMRYTLTTVTAARLIILVTMAILPERREIPVGPSSVAAQAPDEPQAASPEEQQAQIRALQERLSVFTAALNQIREAVAHQNGEARAEAGDPSTSAAELREQVATLEYELQEADLTIRSRKIDARRQKVRLQGVNAELERKLELLAQGAVNGSEVKSDRTAVELAELDVAQADIDVERAELTRDRVRAQLDATRRALKALGTDGADGDAPAPAPAE